MDADKSCVICGSKGARPTYGSIICGSCRVFFIRTAKKPMDQIKCQKGNNCLIKNAPRIKCSGCRFEKCIQSGMIPDEVGKNKKEANPAVVYLNSPHYSQQKSKQSLRLLPYFNSLKYNQSKTELSLCLLPLGLKFIARLQNCTTAYNFATVMAQFDRLAFNENGVNPSEIQINLDANLGEVLMNPEVCSSREAAGWDQMNDVSTQKSYTIRNNYCRQSTLLADFLNAIPEFHNFNYGDKIKLFQQSFCNYVFSSMHYQRWKLNLPRQAVMNRVNRFNISQEAKKRICAAMAKVSSILQENVHPLLTELAITDQEWILLKVISTFYASANFTEEGERVVVSTQTLYSSILGKLIEELYPHLSEEDKIIRFRQLMGITTKIKQLSLYGNQLYSYCVSQDFDGMKGNLSFDIHMRQF